MNLSDLTPHALIHLIGRFMRRYHLIIFFILAATTFGAAVLHVQSMLTTSSTDETYTSNINAGSIDVTTLQRINALRSSSEVQSLPGPSTSARTNPFGE